MSETNIRPINDVDCDQLVVMIKKLAQETGMPEKAKAKAQQYRQALSHQPPLIHGLIVEHNQEISGVSLYYPQYSSWRGVSGVYVLDLFIDETVRAKSIGRRLLGAVCRDATKKWQAAFMTLDVDCQNEAAIKFYHRLGFEIDKSENKMRVFGESFQSVAKG